MIDCIKFAPEAACKVIQKSDYHKTGGGETNNSNDQMNASTNDESKGPDDNSQLEESKRDDNDAS